MLGAVMIVGSARSIALILTDGGVMDTIVHVLAGGLDLVPTVLQAPAMFLICTVFNVFMASGSGQAAVMMPLLLPVADLVGMTRQTVILAFNFGDGFGNYIFPTSTALMGLIGCSQHPLRPLDALYWQDFPGLGRDWLYPGRHRPVHPSGLTPFHTPNSLRPAPGRRTIIRRNSLERAPVSGCGDTACRADRYGGQYF